MAEPRSTAARPLSPHLTIYRWPMTMTMSIAHRVTGSANYVGLLLLAWWLLAAASGPEAFAWPEAFFGSILGKLVLIGFSWSVLHHLLGGLRHLVWDTLHFMDAPWRDHLAWWTLYGSLGLTVLLWLVILLFG
jgi:succinate dehydrogenase / fumarate reductase cytochrome b subunit